MAQTRKKAILQQVQRQRRNRTIASIIVAVVLIAVIVTAAAFLAPKASLVPLPGYLDQCPTGTPAYHAHPHLAINISGSPYLVPAFLGITGSCNRPLHTHATDGVIHVEPSELRDFTLGNFLTIWGNTANDPQFAILNSTQVFNNAHGTVTMTVDGNPYQGDMKSYLLPRNAGDPTTTSGNPCSSAPNCVPTNIVITYTR